MSFKSERLSLLLLSTVILAVSACGVKPKNVDAPETVQEDTYPNSYPKN